MKEDVIRDFSVILLQLNQGHKPSLDMLLHKIAFIKTCTEIDNVDFVFEFLTNN